eukprot:527481-Amphidinium_carterae.1
MKDAIRMEWYDCLCLCQRCENTFYTESRVDARSLMILPHRMPCSADLPKTAFLEATRGNGKCWRYEPMAQQPGT